MRISLKIGLLFAALWIGFKMILFMTLTGPMRYDIRIPGLVNTLFVLFAITLGLYLEKRKQTEGTNLLADIKNGMSAGVPYALIVSLFLYFYYSKIDKEFNEHQISEVVTAFSKQMEDPEFVIQMKEANPDYEVMSKEDIIKAQETNARAALSPGSAMTLTMLGLLLLSTIASIFIAIIYRRLIFGR